MKKVYIDKNETVSSVVEKVINIEDDKVVLYVPRFTKFGESLNNFKLLKREADSVGKSVEIESVDDSVLEHAESVGIKVVNPFFGKNKKPVSDIVMPLKEEKGKHKGRRGSEKKVINYSEEDTDGDDLVEEDRAIPEERPKSRIRVGIGRISLRQPARLMLIALLIAGVLGIAVFVLPSAKVVITQEKINRDFSVSLLASAIIQEPYFSNGQVRVPGTVLEKSKSSTNTYPATGSELVEKKASGEITVFNAFSSDPQPLVLNTRFSSPDGKIFRINKNVTIPGAKIVDNKIVPSSLNVTVYADKAGEEYNIGPSRFRVPGFQGSPKYEGFYADSTSAMSGGFIGVLKVATASDITKGKEVVRKALQDASRAELVLSTPSEIKLLDNVFRFSVTREDIEKTANADGNFSITTHATTKAFGFKENDVIRALKKRLAEELKLEAGPGIKAPSEEELSLKDGALQYGDPRIDFEKKELAMSLKFRSVWVRTLDLQAFKGALLGQNGEKVDSIAKQFMGIESVDLKLWPFWVWSVPKNPGKVSIDVE